jgi:hypothetical protein
MPSSSPTPEPVRALVVNPDSLVVENVIIAPPDFQLPGRLVIADEWGAGPGDAWDPVQARPFRPLAEVQAAEGEPVVVLADQRRAIVESRRPEIEDALLRGNTEAAMEIILQVDRAIRELEASLGPGEVQ